MGKKRKAKTKPKPADEQVAEQIKPEKRPHWVSREVERFIAPVVTALVIAFIYFAVDYITTDPEIEPTVRTVKQHDELIRLLSESVAQQSSSITSLSRDRAGSVYGGASRAMENMEEKYTGVPFDQWDVGDRRLYLAAETQRNDAAKRLGIQPGDAL